jgi:hypothetical protein
MLHPCVNITGPCHHHTSSYQALMLHPCMNRKLKRQGKNSTKPPIPRSALPGRDKGSPSLASGWPPKPMPRPSPIRAQEHQDRCRCRQPPFLSVRSHPSCCRGSIRRATPVMDLAGRLQLRHPPPIPYWWLHGGSRVHKPRRALGRRNLQHIGRGSDRHRLSELFLHRSHRRRAPLGRTLGRRLGYGRESGEEETKRENIAAAETCATVGKKSKHFFNGCQLQVINLQLHEKAQIDYLWNISFAT